ncbi:ribosome biogenesis GTPase Der [Treponema endosymbiont of Eucomonympha sp.]|uniref:ribosome biogenesis GTPase Der n=1 Tax=Treponema endosymbiont of Eucomonympha sp. TaxID=1580831 RepID=UPI000AF885A0|nr:ribosome biogenesis GTPase Der [Treponema endosymbiont of Eucomonympha sp.]
MNPSARLPLVVIVGRPNTGKSTLFNRFVHKRRAITDPTPGVTRDPIEETVFVAGTEIRLMDTGGFKLARTPRARTAANDPRRADAMNAEIDALVTAKTLEAIRRADLIVLLLDAGDITGEDEEFISLLRPHQHKVLCAANKTEGGRLEQEAWNCVRFGFGDFMLLSAEHGDHFPELCERIARRFAPPAPAEADGTAAESGDTAAPAAGEESAAFVGASVPEEGTAEEGMTAEPEEALERKIIRVAVLGKPNTGKSTLTNRLTRSDLSIVSAYAGTTRDVVAGFFSWGGRDFQILDTAGIRRKAKVTENVEYYSVNRAIKTLDDADVAFLLIDATEGLAEQDKKIAALASERGKALIFALNKWDTQEQDKTHLKKTVEHIRIMFAHMSYAPVVAVSATEGTGVRALLHEAVELFDELHRKIDTRSLNLALAGWIVARPSPYNRGSTFKLRYMVQKSANPVSFLVFASRPENVPAAYVAYIKNKIRSDLGFGKIPVQVELRTGRKNWEERGTPSGAERRSLRRTRVPRRERPSSLKKLGR